MMRVLIGAVRIAIGLTANTYCFLLEMTLSPFQSRTKWLVVMTLNRQDGRSKLR